MTKDDEYDIYRDSPVRYLGYSSEVGEAFRPLIHKRLVLLSYGICIGYVLADLWDKSSKEYKLTGDSARTARIAGHVFLWQLIATLILPAFTINRITWAAGRLVSHAKIPDTTRKVLPTAIGLCSIPFIIKPIDRLVDYMLFYRGKKD